MDEVTETNEELLQKVLGGIHVEEILEVFRVEDSDRYRILCVIDITGKDIIKHV